MIQEVIVLKSNYSVCQRNTYFLHYVTILWFTYEIYKSNKILTNARALICTWMLHNFGYEPWFPARPNHLFLSFMCVGHCCYCFQVFIYFVKQNIQISQVYVLSEIKMDDQQQKRAKIIRTYLATTSSFAKKKEKKKKRPDTITVTGATTHLHT